jgi:hypothetical protein
MFRPALLAVFALTQGLGGLSCRAASDPVPAADRGAEHAALARELVERGAREQELRRQLIDQGAAADMAVVHELETCDLANTERLVAIVDAHGWPTRAHFGDAAAQAAWLILQHSPDHAFQVRMLPELERRMRAGDVRGGEYALLYDRVQMRAGRPQRYGSQFRFEDGKLVMHECEDPSGLDARRAELGLEPIDAYRKRLEERHAPTKNSARDS